MKRLISGWAMLIYTLIFVWTLAVADIHFSPPWIDIVVAFSVLAFMVSGIGLIKKGKETLKEAKNG